MSGRGVGGRPDWAGAAPRTQCQQPARAAYAVAVAGALLALGRARRWAAGALTCLAALPAGSGRRLGALLALLPGAFLSALIALAGGSRGLISLAAPLVAGGGRGLRAAPLVLVAGSLRLLLVGGGRRAFPAAPRRLSRLTSLVTSGRRACQSYPTALVWLQLQLFPRRLFLPLFFGLLRRPLLPLRAAQGRVFLAVPGCPTHRPQGRARWRRRAADAAAAHTHHGRPLVLKWLRIGKRPKPRDYLPLAP